jgi:hypothetical protein
MRAASKGAARNPMKSWSQNPNESKHCPAARIHARRPVVTSQSEELQWKPNDSLA